MTSPKPKRDKNDVWPHRVELAGQTVAGGIGTAFGAAKLRDAYKQEHPREFDRKVLKVTNKAIRHGAKPATVTRAVHTVQAGKPPFKALVALTGAGATAAAAHHYQQINNWTRKRKDQVSSLAKSEPRRAPSPRVRVRATPPPRHAPKPYVGQHRALSLTDNLKATAMLHSKHLAGAMEGVADLFKAGCPRCAPLVAGEARYGHVAGVGRVRILGWHEGGTAHVLGPNDGARLVHRDRLSPRRSKGSPMTKSAFGVELEKGMEPLIRSASGAVKLAGGSGRRARFLSSAKSPTLPGRSPFEPGRAGGLNLGGSRTREFTRGLSKGLSVAGVATKGVRGMKAKPGRHSIETLKNKPEGWMQSPQTRRGRLSQGAGRHRPAMAKSAFDVEIEKAHVLRDTAALAGATAAGALLAKPGLGEKVGRAAGVMTRRAVNPFRQATPRRPMPGPGPIGKSASDDAAKALKTLKFAKPKPGVRPTGPGSARAKMSPTAWESQKAAAGRVKKSCEPEELLKASAFGTKGDKRNTKYYLAGGAAANAGAFAGRRLGARAGGSTVREVRRASRTDLAGSIERGVKGTADLLGGGPRHSTGVHIPGPMAHARSQRAMTRSAMADIKAVKGGKAMLRGGAAGAALGATGGAVAYHGHRKRVGLA